MIRILIVDDEPSTVESLADLLRAAGYTEIRVASAAAEALAIAVEFVPDIVFMDIELPDMSGYDVALQLHQHRHLQRMRLIALTNHAGHPGREHARTSGFERYLVKPLSSAVLQEVLNSVA